MWLKLTNHVSSRRRKAEGIKTKTNCQQTTNTAQQLKANQQLQILKAYKDFQDLPNSTRILFNTWIPLQNSECLHQAQLKLLGKNFPLYGIFRSRYNIVFKSWLKFLMFNFTFEILEKYYHPCINMAMLYLGSVFVTRGIYALHKPCLCVTIGNLFKKLVLLIHSTLGHPGDIHTSLRNAFDI